ncbi:MAG: protein-glutamate O-methyltransferase CheR [Verrucomicrobiota bacterium]
MSNFEMHQQVVDAKTYEYIRKLVYEHSRINLGNDKMDLVSARLNKRLRETKIPTIHDYIEYLNANEGEMENLIDVISTNHTFFFREIQHFEFMQTNAIPELHHYAQTHSENSFRLWCAASSSGDEPYSLAIQLNEYFKNLNFDWEIHATDISNRILEKAKNAVFPEERLKEVRPELLRLYFQKGFGVQEGFYRVKENLRNKVSYSRLNLLQPQYPFQKPFHVIFCRNVMIYFDRPTQQELVNHLAQYLVPGGYLMIGHSESLTGITHPLKSVKPAIYQKI